VLARTPPANSPGVYTWPNHYSSTPLHLKFLRGSESQYDEWIDPRGPPPPLGPDEVPCMQNATVVGTDPATKPISIGPPRNRKEALLSEWWKGYYNAEKDEMKSHMENKTWVLIPRSQVPILRDRWAYDDKLAPGGKVIERFKARLTAMGCFQKAGVDYTDTYASVMSTRMFRY